MSDATRHAPPGCFIGCDVGKAAVVVFDDRNGRIWSVANEPPALAAFAARLDPDCLVICEATGGYEAALLDAMSRAGRPVHRADARKVKAFIRSLGTLGKTDAIDARALARYGAERHDRLARWRPRPAARDALHALVATRADLVRDRVALLNRLAAPGAGPVRARLQRLLDALTTEIAGLEAEIAALVETDPELSSAAEALRVIPGIGTRTAIALIALMPELGTLGRRQAAALAGLAPHPRQSGKSDAYRCVRGGRPGLKPILFMAAMAARRSKSPLATFYDRLRQNGKKPLVAITALMRKLVVIANAKLRPPQPKLS